MSYKIIACCDVAYGISKNGILPWCNTIEGKLDMQHFINTTATHIVCMGRKTWESIPIKYRPLKNRINIVLSTTLKQINDVNVFTSVEQCHDFLNTHKDYKNWKKYVRWVIGGKKIYEEYLKRNWVHEIILTKIHNDYKCNLFLPEFKKFKIYDTHTCYCKTTIEIIKYWYNNEEEYQLLKLLQNILNNGNKRPDRTGIGTISLFGNMLKYTMSFNKEEHSFWN